MLWVGGFTCAKPAGFLGGADPLRLVGAPTSNKLRVEVVVSFLEEGAAKKEGWPDLLCLCLCLGLSLLLCLLNDNGFLGGPVVIVGEWVKGTGEREMRGRAGSEAEEEGVGLKAG